jgi:hypothetical protein
MGRHPHLEPAPEPKDLLERAVHEIVRDFPEALSTLRARGIDVATAGGRLLAQLPGAEDLARSLARSSAWRRGPVNDGPEEASDARRDGEDEPPGDPVEPRRPDRA